MTDSNSVLVSGGAGYIGSHVVHVLRQNGFTPVVLDNLSNGNRFAVRGDFVEGDVANTALVRSLCRDFRPVAALHFAAFIEVGESVVDPQKYFSNNRDKSRIFFDTLAAEGVGRIVFSSTAAVYGEPPGMAPITEDYPASPINPYGQSKWDAENYLRTVAGVKSVTLRYFNVAGAVPEAGLGEAHAPESHLVPRVLLPLLDMPAAVQVALGLSTGFKIFGEDYPTRDGTAVRDYLHVLDLADAHVLALRRLLDGGNSDIFNLGTGIGSSVKEIVQAVRDVLARPDFTPATGPRRDGDPAMLVASGEKARQILRWKPARNIHDMIASAATWHQSAIYAKAILDRH